MITGITRSPPMINAGIKSSFLSTFFSGKIGVVVVVGVAVVVVVVVVELEEELEVVPKHNRVHDL